MRMQSNYLILDNDKKISKIKSKDIVSIETIWEAQVSRYLVIRVSKSNSFIDLLPLEQFFKNQEKIEAPVLSVPFYMIKDIKKIDKTNLLFLANHLNPHIINALEGM
ncbi:hypothetical protein CMI47_21090 [Candidatus Pacearchaeota archaeon]|nr:hypothetical protein [Candidatus Pacearchaeota archaeon]